MNRRSDGSRKTGRGFTVVEMLIAVGAVALIGVGLAQLFERTGQTVRTGRRVSANNEYAALMERTLRADLQSITRNGFLVIRHREVGATGALGVNTGILLSPTDRNPTPRRRRVDQLAFFTEGRYSSLRDPLHPDKFPTGSASRVWYGHGLSRPTDVTTSLTDENQTALTFGAPGPAQYAGSWTLLRHQTVMARPQVGSVSPASSVGVVAPALANQWDDSAIQVGMQPASPTIFRNERLSGIGGVAWARLGETVPAEQPVLASGIVDVASMDLSQVRARVLGTGIGTGVINPRSNGILPISTFDAAPLSAFTPGQNAALPSSPGNYMKEWMAFSLPAGPTSGAPDLAITDGSAAESRMRYELTPPDYLGSVQGGLYTESWQRSDQLMLASNNLIPGCSEFIVEWSYGLRYPNSDPLGRTGQLIWHGLPRYLDLDADGSPDVTAPEARVADVYHASSTNGAVRSRDRLDIGLLQTTLDPGTGQIVIQVLPATDPRTRVPSELVHLPANASSLSTAWPEGRALYSCFGYVDPQYTRSAIVNDPNNSPDPAQPDTLTWRWPRLIRVTMSLVDPSEPENEQTYQFVFEVPLTSNGI